MMKAFSRGNARSHDGEDHCPCAGAGFESRKKSSIQGWGGEWKEREIVILVVVLAFLLVGDENSPRNLSHDPGASWDHRVEELRAKMKGKETEDKDYPSFSFSLRMFRSFITSLFYPIFRKRRASCAIFIDVWEFLVFSAATKTRDVIVRLTSISVEDLVSIIIAISVRHVGHVAYLRSRSFSIGVRSSALPPPTLFRYNII